MAGRDYSNKDNKKGNMVRAVPGEYGYLSDPAKRDAEVRVNMHKAAAGDELRKAEVRVNMHKAAAGDELRKAEVRNNMRKMP